MNTDLSANEETVAVEDSCLQCKGVQGPDHRHTCAACGADPGPSVLSIGDDSTEDPVLVCDRFCLHEIDPDNEILSDVDPARWDQDRMKKKLQQEMRSLKQRAVEVGLPWI